MGECSICGGDHLISSYKFQQKARSYRARARKYGVENTLTACEIVGIFRQQKAICYYCNKPIDGMWSVDHKVSMALGGGNTLENAVVTCHQCNVVKSYKHTVGYTQIQRGQGFKTHVIEILETNQTWMNVRDVQKQCFELSLWACATYLDDLAQKGLAEKRKRTEWDSLSLFGRYGYDYKAKG